MAGEVVGWNPPMLEGGSGGGEVGDATETVGVFDVSTSIASLRAGGSGLTGIFADLGGGTQHGETITSNANEGAWLYITLDAAFVASLQAVSNSNGQIALGTAIQTIGGTNNQYIFACTGGPAFLGITYTPCRGFSSVVYVDS